METSELILPGLKIFSPQKFTDERGFFFESYRQSRFQKAGVELNFVQDNISVSKKNTIRGLHFQSSPGQAKLITCLTGKIWDVAVDIRKESPTFGKWEAFILDGETLQQLFVPVGFAHGFCVLSETALVQYKVSSYYKGETEKTIRWNDPLFQIKWPISNPILSPRDQVSPYFEEVCV